MRLIYSPEEYYRFKAPKTLELIEADKDNWRTVCPFCQHSNAKFYIHRNGGYYQCWHCGEKGSIVKFHAHFSGMSETEAYTALSSDKDVKIAKEPEIPAEYVAKLHTLLLNSALALEHIKSKWLFSEEAIEHFNLGLLDGYLAFPIYNKTGQCVNIRLKKIWPQPGDPKVKNYVNGDVSYGKTPRLYPYTTVLTEEEIFLVAGEKDLLSTWSKGIKNVVTGTHGEGTFPSNFAFDLAGKTIHIVYDNDRAGQLDAKKVYEELKLVSRVDIVSLPEMVAYNENQPRKDLTDFWLLEKTPEELLNLVKPIEVKPKDKYELEPLITADEQKWLGDSNPTFIDSYVEFGTSRVNSPASFNRLCALWIASNLVGRNTISVGGTYTVYPNIWCIIIGPSTAMQKSATTIEARKVLDYVDRECVALTSFTPQGLYKRLAMRESEISTAVYFDEISTLFDQVKNLDFMAGTRETLIKIFNCEPLNYDKAKEEVTIRRSYTTMLGNGTPSGLAEVLSHTDISRGLLVRFLVSLQNEQMEYRPELENETYDQTLQKLAVYREAKRIRNKWSIPWKLQLKPGLWLQAREESSNPDKNQYLFYMNRKALDRYNAFLQQTQYTQFSTESISLVHQRLPMLLRKLSTLYAACDPYVKVFGNVVDVNLEHVLMGIRDLELFRESMLELVANVGLTPLERNVNSVLDMVSVSPRITRREIARRLSGASVKDVDLVLATCIDRGIIRSNKLPSGDTEFLVAS